MRKSTSLIRVAWLLGFLTGSILLATVAGWMTGFPLRGTLIKALLLGAVVLITLWLLWKLLRLFLWRVGRRLAFSYFLMGILPIPMVALFAFLVLYLLAGYFLGHLYRDASGNLQRELDVAVAARLTDLERTPSKVPAQFGSHLYAYYRDGKRIAGSPNLPERWTDWLDRSRSASDQTKDRENLVSYVSTGQVPLTIASAKKRGRNGVIAVFSGNVALELADRSLVWVVLESAADREERLVRVNLGDRDFFVRNLRANPDDPARLGFFGLETDASEGKTLHGWQRPFVWWGELLPPLRQLSDGQEVSPYVTATLNASPSTIYRHLLSASGEIDAAVWGSLVAIAGVLLSIYSVAIAMAFFMIFTLSRAVNQLSHATESVRSGDFSTRIPVRRHDQIGELHESFNEMAVGLEESVAAVAQKEVLEKELQIARELQQRLLPRDIPASDSVEFATLFEPSAAIGGDYFDILRLDENRLMVVIADVSGHGLPTGLRMAMLKAALVILVQDGRGSIEIFERLSTLVRAERERRFFVTCTLAEVDFENDTLALTNAGHPPTYLLRRGKAIELALEGNPLGALGERYGQKELRLEHGDIVVWLSDGLIEATNQEGEPFGYERLQRSLEGTSTSASEVNKRLISAVEAFSGGEAVEDDRTLVSMRYSAPEIADSTPSAE
jgi:HAMP domain-containing protein